jgi:O-antigen ligase
MEGKLTLRSGAIAACLALAAPGAMGGALALAPLTALIGLIATPWASLPRLVRESGLALKLLVGFLAWALLSALWSPAHEARTAEHLAGGMFTGLLAAAAFAWRPERRDSTLVRQTIIAFAVFTTALGLIEWFGGFPLNRLAHWGDPPSMLARAPMMGTAVLCVLVWGAIALIWARGERVFAMLLFFAALACALASTMAANALALVLGAIGFWATLKYGGRVLLGAGYSIAGWLTIAPFASFAAGLLINPAQLPTSWGTRVTVWASTASATLHRDLMEIMFGAGLGAFRKLSPTLATGEGQFHALHPHSASLQIWFELGVVGASFSAAALVAFTDAIARTLKDNAPARAAATATLLAAAVIANVSYGAWEEWWIATLFLAAGMVAASRFSPAP